MRQYIFQLPVIIVIAAAGALPVAAYFSPATANPTSGVPGPVEAIVERVVDGDNVRVRALIWVDQEVEVSVRLAGLDAPEIFRPKCESERDLGRRARAYVEAALPPETRVKLYGVTYGKYAGRVVARIETDRGRDLGAALIGAGLAAPGSMGAWCG